MVHDDIPLVDISDDLEGGFNAVLVSLTCLESSLVLLAREAEDVECVFASKSDKLATFRPVNLTTVLAWSNIHMPTTTHVLGVNFNPADKLT